MDRKIVIRRCDECGYHDHKGAFAQISYVPVCRLAERELPYTTSIQRNTVQASQVKGIPDWCPLPKDK